MPPDSVNAQLASRRRRADRRAWAALTILWTALWISLFQVYDGGRFIDPFNHILYLTSLLNDRDLDFANDIVAANTFDRQRLLQLGQIAPNGMIKNNWPPGAALLWAPVFLPMHLATQLTGHLLGVPAPPRFGFLPMLSVSLATAVYGYLALWLLYRLARLWHPPGPAGAAAAVVLACSPLPFHVFRCTASDHGLATLTVAWWLLLCLSPCGAHPRRRGLWLGLAAGLMVLVRWQDVVFGVAGVAAVAPHGLRLARRSARDAWAALGLATLGFLAVFGVQMIVWMITYGAWLVSPHGPGYIHWDRPLFPALLFSGKGGMLHWHPAMAVGFVGLVAVAVRRRLLGAGLWLTVLIHLYICAAVDDWHGEWGIGNRRLCALLPLLVLGLAEVFAAVRRRTVALLLALLLTSLALGNWVFLLFGYRGSMGVFSPLNQSGWATLAHFWQPVFANIAAHPLITLIDNSLFTPWLDLRREVTLAQFGIFAAFFPVAVLVVARRMGRGRRVRRWMGPVLAGVLFGLQIFLLAGLRSPSSETLEVGAFALRLEQFQERDDADGTAVLAALQELDPTPAISRAAVQSERRRVEGLQDRYHVLLASRSHPGLESMRLGLTESPIGSINDKMDLRDALDVRFARWKTLFQSRVPMGSQLADVLTVGDHGLVTLYWPHAWDQRLMQRLFERIVEEGDTEAIRTFFDLTARTPVLWWNCKWHSSFERGDYGAAAGALERLRTHNPLDVQTLELLVRTLRRLAAKDPSAFARAAEREALARSIRDWELTRLRAALESPLYERGFIEDRLNYYLSVSTR